MTLAVHPEERIQHFVAPHVADPQIIAHVALAAKPQLLGQGPRRGVVWLDQGLHAVQPSSSKQ